MTDSISDVKLIQLPTRVSPLPAPGTVALVGAGPGDPELLTLAAYRALQHADVVVHDALVSPEILALIPEKTEQIYVGKRGGSPSMRQGEISELLVRLAQGNRRVVRLKGGDPFVFGRGGEEACHLVSQGIMFSVIPGLTSGIAGPTYAGIPVTHRDVNAHVAFITGHESRDHHPSNDDHHHISRIDWEGVARTFPVMVLYMAIKNLPLVVKRLTAAGRSVETPIALIRWATTARQQTLVSTLGRVVREIEELKIRPPAIIVIGDVVNYRSLLSWFPDETLSPPGT
ncbi:MAG: uroporphyrinogen-III C-methyltransferase [Magnetococcales bacterium]|nr:uroporphyrinogen-III C-methyltransferase [Magnetococcales bacterium]MBF0150270.1 uroporphyrinogen-III C-methyltransferase [Magnetococcales bacterium]MBF0172148.1 uroporphyrinogen-III C-methyltransferase [Magnetococcales bacterium]MBF0347948.1 uroporphyrinogen-III C-methyltransferase [Magnetococcales bacterium]MBF0630552.1 uroporphyrinogen-III C-methyltransferase [Magnetococcales bacterium]